MPAQRIKIELDDSEGNKLTVSFQGSLSRKKALQLLDIAELLGGVSSIGSEDIEKESRLELSKYEKLQLIVKRRFLVGWFTSQDVLTAYEDDYNEPIGLSTVSTYLARLTDHNFLARSGSKVRYRYKIRRRVQIRERQRLPRPPFGSQ